jgi:hypothetical protein
MGGISVAEKRSQLEAAGEPWPICDCHGLPKLWKKSPERRAGGTWFCRAYIRGLANKWKLENIDKVRADDNRRAEIRKQDPSYYLKKTQYLTLYKSRRTLEKATNRAEEMYAQPHLQG